MYVTSCVLENKQTLWLASAETNGLQLDGVLFQERFQSNNSRITDYETFFKCNRTLKRVLPLIF